MMNNDFNISIKDFQIIKNASLSFSPGLNCIIGQSNNGKSAILRAAKSAIYNIPGTTSVRLGCNSYAVGIQANGHTVIFQKGANSAYKVDGLTLGKIGRTQIPEVANALGIKELNLNGTNEEINFLDQMEKPFLLDRSETELFRFIVDSGKDSNVTLALKTLTQDRQQLTRDITTTEGRLEQVESMLKQQEENLKGSDDKLSLYTSVIDIGPRITRSKELKALREALNSQIEGISSLKEESNKTEAILSVVDPSITNVNNLVKKQEVLGLLSSSITKATEEKKELSKKKKKLDKIDGTNLQTYVDSYRDVNDLVSSINEINNSLTKYKDIKYPEVSEDFNDRYNTWFTLKTIISTLAEGKAKLDSLKADKNDIEKELKEVTEEINKLGVCPMCGQPLHI